MVVVALGMTNATEKTVLTNSSASTWTGDAEGYSTTIDGMTISYTKGGSPAVAPSADHIRVYKGATLTVKSANGEAITSIVINCTEKKYCADIIVGGETPLQILLIIQLLGLGMCLSLWQSLILPRYVSSQL